MESILITGANSGLGFEVSKLFAKKGYQVITVCRTIEKAKITKRKIVELFPESKILPMEAELSSIDSIKSCINDLEITVDYLICNAGISNTRKPELSKDGYELIFSVNHLAHYFLTVELLNQKKSTLKSIVVVSSNVHNPRKTKGQFPPPEFKSVQEFAFPKSEFENWKKEADKRYVHSKLCNVLFTYGMANRLQGITSTKINAFNPGFMIGTNLARDQSKLTQFMLKYILPLMKNFISEMKTVEESAIDLMNLCLKVNSSGGYYNGTNKDKSSDLSYNKELINNLWMLSEELTQTSLKK